MIRRPNVKMLSTPLLVIMYNLLIDEFCLWSECLRLHDIRFLEAVDGAGVDAPVLPVVEDVDARHLAPL